MIDKIYSVDVIIPVYNGEKFIKRAVESVLKQTLLPNRIIIIDDNSSDSTPNVIESIQKNNKLTNLKIEFYKGQHKGPSEARNIGIRKVTADYVAFLDVDDEWYPSKLEKQIELFDKSKNKDLGLVYCMFDVGDNCQDNKYPAVKAKVNDFFRGKVFDKIFINNLGIRSPSLILIKNCIFKDIGFFDTTLSGAEDFDFFLRIAKRYEFDYVSEPLARINNEENSLSKNSWKMLNGLLNFYKKWKSILNYDQKKNIADRVFYEISRFSIFSEKIIKSKIFKKIIKEISKPIYVNFLSKINFLRSQLIR